MRLMTLLIVLISLIGCSYTPKGKLGCVVTGTIVDEANKPVSAEIHFDSDKMSHTEVYHCDGNGKFFAILNPGEYDLTIWLRQDGKRNVRTELHKRSLVLRKNTNLKNIPVRVRKPGKDIQIEVNGKRMKGREVISEDGNVTITLDPKDL